MLGNSVCGDCVLAAIGHAVTTWRSYNPPMNLMTEQEAIAAYSAITGYIPGNPATDHGTDPQAALEYWRTKGIYCGGVLDKLNSYEEIDFRDHQAVTNAVAGDGCILVGVALREAQDQGQEEPWRTINSPIVGGHAVLANEVTPQGPVVVTWGKLVQIEWAWWDACLECAFGLHSPDWHPPV